MSKVVYKVQKHPRPTSFQKWAVIDVHTKNVVSSHYYRKNAVSAAALANSIHRKYGSL